MDMIRILILVFLFCIYLPIAGQDTEQEKIALKNSIEYTHDGNKKIAENNFIAAETSYRNAIAKSNKNTIAPFNLGTAYYQNNSYGEAFTRFKEAGETSTSLEEKHKAFHNMGNIFMKQKAYGKAVEAYKESLRNDSKDEETRYNLALAKEMLKREEQNKDKDKNEEQNKDKDKNEEQDKKDKNDKEEKENKEQENKEEGDQDKEENKDKDENKKEDGKDDKKNEDEKPKGDKKNEPTEQPKENKLSKQQVENLLRAMQNAEKEVQEKIDAKKVKGARVNTEKDW